MLSREDTKKILEGVMTSKRYKEAKDIMELLNASYMYLLNLENRVEIRKEYNATKNFYSLLNNKFCQIIKCYYDGNIIKALDFLHSLLVDDNTGYLNLKRESLKKNTPLFRMRGQDKYKLYNRKEMFHIPTDKTQFVQNYRYSLNGFPCLYLGASLYVCWEETRRSDLDHVNYVKMVPTHDITFISTLCPDTLENSQDVIQYYIFALCSKMADNDNVKFQFQYAFPELLLHLLISLMKNGDDAWGIKYVSARYFENDGQFSSEPIFYNYVIPKREPVDKDDHLSIELKKAFKVSEVKAFYVNKVYGQLPNRRSTRPNEYANTHYKLLEDDLEVKKFL